jgi:hypothetical protein
MHCLNIVSDNPNAINRHVHTDIRLVKVFDEVAETDIRTAAINKLPGAK